MPQQDLQELFQRLEHLERKCRRMEARIAELEENYVTQRNQKASAAMDQAGLTNDATEESEGTLKNEGQQVGENTFVFRVDDQPGGLTEPVAKEPAVKAEPVRAQQLYLPAPTQDGLFQQASDYEQVGKSIYQLTTSDGLNGTFILLDTPDAIATAMISVSTFVKPACKVMGNTSVQPRHIITETEGTATREGSAWRVVQKAFVRFE